ncbi:NucA/NucB deoxyribonuclease domain-containing protein [Rhodococcus sp. NPDC060176]|uniref:NucA/NucB deoxyribonuclease domain-containing protein n=1 Tax=Rhodococcus sp. NPDC060176 TaxID=3347062 RepID=UPI00364E8DCA
MTTAFMVIGGGVATAQPPPEQPTLDLSTPEQSAPEQTEADQSEPPQPLTTDPAAYPITYERVVTEPPDSVQSRQMEQRLTALPPCDRHRYLSCESYTSRVEQWKKDTPSSPPVMFGLWGVYFQLNVNSQYGLPRSTAVVEGYTIALEGAPVPGTLDIKLTGHDLGAQTDIMDFVMPLSPGSNQYHDESFIIAPPKLGSNSINFVISFTSHTPVPPVDPGPTYIGTTQTLRCDNKQEISSNTGCVNPKYIPSVTYAKSVFPGIWQNISDDQDATDRGLLNKPLHRVSGPQIDANRAAACSTARKNALIGATPPPALVPAECDEYPFASSAEGGATASIKWVRKAENQAQSTLMEGFYRQNRLIVGDPFTVRTTQ